MQAEAGGQASCTLLSKKCPPTTAQRSQGGIDQDGSLGVISRVDEPTSCCAGIVVVHKK